MSKQEFPIILSQEQVSEHHRRWCLSTHCRNSDGEKGSVSMQITHGGYREEDRFRFFYCDESQGPFELIPDQEEWERLIELHESHAFDEFPDCGESLSEAEAEKVLAKCRERFFDTHLNQMIANGMGLGAFGVIESLKRRWSSITDLIKLQQVW